MVQAIHTVSYDSDAIVYVAFSRGAAADFIATEQREWENENAEYLEAMGGAELPFNTDELPLVDNYGFPCQISDAGILFPWLRNVKPEVMPFYPPEYQARKDREYTPQMSMGG